MYEVVTLTVTAFMQNCRLLGDTSAKLAVVIDPGGEATKIVSQARKLGWQIKQIWLTHSHIDHCGAVAELVKQTGARLFGHSAEREFRARLEEIASIYGVAGEDFANCPEPDTYLKGGEVLEFAAAKFKVMFTPGHSPGHVVFYDAASNLLLAGDTIFQGSIGRTDLPGGDYEQLISSIKRELLVLPDDTKVLCGHGPDTTIGHERKTNPFLQD